MHEDNKFLTTVSHRYCLRLTGASLGPDLLAFIRYALPGTRSLRLSKLLVSGSCLTYELASVLSRAN
ncbi:hypothetical protein HID58_002823 [Brassica napus]|uniref:Uncharacterized protein n=1 Tax=Brassica napus TaxID=3708 RepID=A0ABQ8ENE1_BRANA|nr:hypothetical protein HID58_002823 [Brassica napus]